MARGNNRQTVFHDQWDYEKFLWLVGWAKGKHPFRLHNFVLMPNHVHLLVQVQCPLDLSRAMQKILQVYSDYFREKNSFVGHLWQGRYKSVLLPTDRSLLLCGRYIEMNPVRAALEQNPEDYSWSSYRFYVGNRDSPHFIEENPGYVFLANSANDRKRIYQEIVSEIDGDQSIKKTMGLIAKTPPGRPKKK